MKRILVTGAGGQLGRTLQDLAPEYPNLDFHFYDRNQLDITDEVAIMKTFQETQPEICINCAAYTHVDEAERHPEKAFKVNAEGVKHLAMACKQHGTTLIHISTDYVFDGEKTEGYYPQDIPNPINAYGRSKLKGEEIIKQSLEKFFVIRTSWLYSKKYGPNFYLTILEKAKKGEQLEVVDTQVGCPTEAQGLSRHILGLISTPNNNYGISHFTGGKAMTWFQFARQILQENGLLETTRIGKGGNYLTFAQRPVNSILLSPQIK